MIFDDMYLYIGVKCYVFGKDYVVLSLWCDYWVGGSDNIIFFLDFFWDCINVFVFGMNLYGVMWEVFIFNGGNSMGDWFGEWDNKWWGELVVFDEYWFCEVVIFFSMICFLEG